MAIAAFQMLIRLNIYKYSGLWMYALSKTMHTSLVMNSYMYVHLIYTCAYSTVQYICMYGYNDMIAIDSDRRVSYPIIPTLYSSKAVSLALAYCRHWPLRWSILSIIIIPTIRSKVCNYLSNPGSGPKMRLYAYSYRAVSGGPGSKTRGGCGPHTTSGCVYFGSIMSRSIAFMNTRLYNEKRKGKYDI